MKKIISLIVIISMLATGLFILTGCGNGKENNNKNEIQTKVDNTVEISNVLGKGKVTLNVPKNDDGTPKYEFTTEKPAGATANGTFYLETDNVVMVFSTSGLSYNTSQKYKDKYGEKEASFENYLEFIEDTDLFNKKSNLPGLEQFEINGRKALRYYSRVGSPEDYKYNGYFYMIGADDIYKGSKVNLLVCYKDEEKPTESKEFDQETLDIINSIKITLNQ